MQSSLMGDSPTGVPLKSQGYSFSLSKRKNVFKGRHTFQKTILNFEFHQQKCLSLSIFIYLYPFDPLQEMSLILNTDYTKETNIYCEECI